MAFHELIRKVYILRKSPKNLWETNRKICAYADFVLSDSFSRFFCSTAFPLSSTVVAWQVCLWTSSPTHKGMFFTTSVFFICSAEVGLKAQNQAWYTGNFARLDYFGLKRQAKNIVRLISGILDSVLRLSVLDKKLKTMCTVTADDENWVKIVPREGIYKIMALGPRFLG
jgi:hypothetical protein